MSAITVPPNAMKYSPAPTAMPSAAVIHIVVAVVIPLMDSPSLKITPAPRNPMPVTMLEAMRSGESDHDHRAQPSSFCTVLAFGANDRPDKKRDD